MSAALQHGGDRFRVETTLFGLISEYLGRCAWGKGGAVWAWLGHGVIGVGNSKETGRSLQRRRPGTTVVTRPIDTLMMETGSRDET